MENIKYYCVKLNGYNNKETYYGLKNKNTFLEEVLRKEYTTLNKTTLENDFCELDNKITINPSSILVEGSFPIITYEKDGKLYDVITDTLIPYASNINEFGYTKKEEFSNRWANFLLSILDDESKERYKKSLNELKESCSLNNVSFLAFNNDEKLSLVEINGKLYDVVNKNRVYKKRENTVYSGVICDKVTDLISDDFLYNYDEMLSEAVRIYNTFVSCNFNLDINKRIRK